MKYTYQIKFGSSDYLDLNLVDAKMDGEWINDTMIWTEQINEVYITKKENSDVYDILESWHDDDDMFDERIMVKVLKNEVEDSLHWFGIKWGKIDLEKKTYSVQPIVYDLWSRYFMVAKDWSVGEDIIQRPRYHYFGASDTYESLDYTSGSNPGGVCSFRGVLTGILEATEWPSSDIASSFMFGDDYEDTTPLGTVRGVKEDYVTGERSWMHGAGGAWPTKISFQQYLDRLKLFNVYVFFDSNDKLRFEHIKFFNDKLTDNAVDFSAYITDENDIYSYEQTDLTISETFKMGSQEKDDDEDFLGYSIVYSDNRNRPDIASVETTYPWYSNLQYIYDNSITDRGVIYSATSSKAYKWFNIDMNTLVEGNNLVLNYSSGQFCGSQDFYCASSLAYPLTVEVNTISGNVDVYIKDRSSGAALSNKVNVSSSGTTTGTLTATGEALDGYLTIEAKANGAISCTIKLEEPYIPNNIYQDVPTLEAEITKELKTNAAFSHGNIFANWWQHNRPSSKATYNGSDYVFDATNYNLRRDTMKFHYSGVIEPLYGFNDGTRVGRIEKWTRYLDTDFYEVDIIYQED